MNSKTGKKFWKYKRFWLVIILAIIAALGLSILRSAKAAQNMAAALAAKAIQTTTVEKGSISDTIEGSGTLKVAETEEVYIPSGLTASEILVETGDTVKAGDILAKIDDDSILNALVSAESSIKSIKDTLNSGSSLTSLEKEQLNNKKEALEDLKETLTTLRENPVVTATTDGTVGAISLAKTNESKPSTPSTSTQNSSTSSLSDAQSAVSSMSSMSDTGDDGVTFISLVASTRPVAVVAAEEDLETTEEQEDITFYEAEGSEDGDNSDDNQNTGSSTDPTASREPAPITSFSSVKEQLPATLKAGELVSKSTIEQQDTDEGYTISISWNADSEKFEAGRTYTATVELTAKESYSFSDAADQTLKTVIDSANFDFVDEEGSDKSSTLKFTIKYEIPPDKSSSGEIITSDVENPTGGTNDSLSGFSGSFSDGSSSGSVSSAAATDVASLYNSYQDSAFTLNKSDKVLVSITVDELDILSVKVGQKATITLNAISGKEFEGSISKVADAATTSGGSSKYAVEITLPKDEQMKIGMSATAVITTSEASDILTLPMNALQQRGNETFVYTQQDEEGNLSGEVAVETGLSNSSTVEIKSGLSEGDTVYYIKADSSMENFDFGGGDMPKGGPSGDGPGAPND